MKHYTFEKRKLMYDMLRSVLGLIVILPLLLLMNAAIIMQVILATISILFVAFSIRTCFRYNTVFTIAEDALLVTNGLKENKPKRYHFSDLVSIKVRYYSAQRDRKNGWMDLKIKFKNKTVHVDSALLDFEDFLQSIIDITNYTEFDETSEANILALGIIIPVEQQTETEQSSR